MGRRGPRGDNGDDVEVTWKSSLPPRARVQRAVPAPHFHLRLAEDSEPYHRNFGCSWLQLLAGGLRGQESKAERPQCGKFFAVLRCWEGVEKILSKELKGGQKI